MTVDVLIPTYKPQRKHLIAALESLKKQTFTEWKAFIHDDYVEGSEAEDIVKPLYDSTKILFDISEKRLGIGGNWNACIQQTSAEFVAFLFQDDLWEPHYLESTVKVLRENPNVGFVSMEHTYLTEGTDDLGEIYRGVEEFREKYVRPHLHRGHEVLKLWLDNQLRPNFIGEPSFVVMRRSAIEKAGPFLEDMPQFLDSEYWLRLLQISDWYNLCGNFGAFRVHPAAASAQNEKTGAGIYDRLRCFDILVSSLSGHMRTYAKVSRKKALDDMVKKFFRRRKEGKSVGGGSGNMKKVIFRHPILIGMAVLKALCTK